MNNEYNFFESEKKWRKEWDKSNSIFDSNLESKKEDYYVLEQFPYPSGPIHMGHLRCYTIGDVIARFRRMQGYNVIRPMGFDSFGLPAENAAIERNLHPKNWTYNNIEIMSDSLKQIGLSYDWDRKIATSDPEYFKHEQAMFIDFLNKGIAYRKKSEVNWDPVDQTVLANEQVVDGKGWRSGAVVEKKELNQWFLKVSEYSERLIDGLDRLTDWPSNVKLMQKNWIGKSEGCNVDFKIIKNEQYTINQDKITTFTTRVETLIGATFLALSVDNDFIKSIAKSNQSLEKFIQEVKKERLTNKEIDSKLGIFTGLYAENPVKDHPLSMNSEPIPIFVVNYVTNEYGSGAVFGCPAHDERDFEFALKYDVKIIQVLAENKNETIANKNTYAGPLKEGFLVNTDKSASTLKSEIVQYLEDKNLGTKVTNYKLRDWGVSRQRYWGCPIPVIYCDKCGVVPEKKENLPISLPEDVQFTGNGNPLENHPTWKNCKCSKCGNDAVRETDTLDTFFESSWYFLRYLDPKNANTPFDIDLYGRLKNIKNDSKNQKKNFLVQEYVGGIEHAILHLLYSRFFMYALQDCNYFQNISGEIEPFAKLIPQGMVCHKTYKLDDKWVEVSNVVKKGNEFFHAENGKQLTEGRLEKMSKSKKNVINPNEIIEIYGADAARLFMLSDCPYTYDIEWTDSGINSMFKFIKRIYRLGYNIVSKDFANNIIDKQNSSKTIQIFNDEIAEYELSLNNYHFNIVIAKIRTLTRTLEQEINNLEKETIISLYKTILTFLLPFVPHLVTECYYVFFGEIVPNDHPLPSKMACDKVEKIIDIVLQVNGKKKKSFKFNEENEILKDKNTLVKEIQKQYPQMDEYLKANDIKIIYVPNRLINVVIK